MLTCCFNTDDQFDNKIDNNIPNIIVTKIKLKMFARDTLIEKCQKNVNLINIRRTVLLPKIQLRYLGLIITNVA